MTSLVRTKIILTILGITAIAGGVFFLTKNIFLVTVVPSGDEQIRYAELPSVATPTPSVTSATTTRAVPILVYHIVRPSYPTDSRSVVGIAHTPEVFDAEMKYLADSNYHVISFGALEAHLKTGTPLPVNPILISFDDGWSDQFTYAFPILQKYHYTATFFVFTNPIGTRGFITWDNLRTLRDAGMTIGSHSLSHPFLTKITNPVILWKEIDGSKKILEKNLGILINEFAYPFGQYNASTTDMVQRAGYLEARGDYMKKNAVQSMSQIYELGALNAPTTTALFIRRFPRAN